GKSRVRLRGGVAAGGARQALILGRSSSTTTRLVRRGVERGETLCGYASVQTLASNMKGRRSPALDPTTHEPPTQKSVPSNTACRECERALGSGETWLHSLG